MPPFRRWRCSAAALQVAFLRSRNSFSGCQSGPHVTFDDERGSNGRYHINDRVPGVRAQLLAERCCSGRGRPATRRPLRPAGSGAQDRHREGNPGGGVGRSGRRAGRRSGGAQRVPVPGLRRPRRTRRSAPRVARRADPPGESRSRPRAAPARISECYPPGESAKRPPRCTA